MRLGYYWLSMYRDVAEVIRKCWSGQLHAPVSKALRHSMIPVASPWSFCKWAIDLVRPFPAGPGGVKFLVMAIDYFTKWVEAKPLKTISGKPIRNFVWESIAHRTTLKGATNEAPFSLVYGSEAVIPAEINVPTMCIASFDESSNSEELCENLNFLEERREMAAIKEAINKQRIASYYDKRVQPLSFQLDDLVWPKNEASTAEDMGKLGPKWEGP
ncbi:uncharacterized protein [Rutidosis leptorrhynchoides]|uniref:uncharacterized protein n=1 Tax=Rutidosis leptorrhynchoides TaxID=125765 RepID=UPI003A99FEC3